MDFADQGGAGPTPYEVLLHAALVGDDRRFPRQVAVEQAWRIFQPLLDAPPPVQAVRPRHLGAAGGRPAARRHRAVGAALDHGVAGRDRRRGPSSRAAAEGVRDAGRRRRARRTPRRAARRPPRHRRRAHRRRDGRALRRGRQHRRRRGDRGAARGGPRRRRRDAVAGDDGATARLAAGAGAARPSADRAVWTEVTGRAVENSRPAAGLRAVHGGRRRGGGRRRAHRLVDPGRRRDGAQPRPAADGLGRRRPRRAAARRSRCAPCSRSSSASSSPPRPPPATTGLLRLDGRIEADLALADTVLGPSLTSIGPGSVMVALAAGMAGILAYETAGSAAVGVAISVTTIPAAAYTGAALALAGYQEGLGALAVLATNIVGIVVAATLDADRAAAGPTAGSWRGGCVARTGLGGCRHHRSCAVARSRSAAPWRTPRFRRAGLRPVRPARARRPVPGLRRGPRPPRARPPRR